MKRGLFLILGIISLPLCAQQVNDAVIIRNDAVFTVISRDKAVYRHEMEILVTKKGSRCADFTCSVNNECSKLTSFSGTVRQADGKTTKIKKKDLSFTEYSEGLADSFTTWYYSPEIKSYPATVTYSYEEKYTDAILGYNSFIPLPFSDGVSLEEASYTLNVPSKDCFRYQQSNIPDPEHYSTEDGEIFVWKIENVPAMKAEPFSPPLHTRIPKVIFSSADFSYEGMAGSAKDWQSIGNWIISLTEDRCTPSQELQNLVSRLTDGAEDDLDKIRRLYAYLGENTRYVSIQLGLGGLRPISPDDVLHNKFGDCKALTFFMQTMLKCCGIDSYYTITNMGADRMAPDFPSLGTSDHVILSVPTAKDTLWIECTNPDVPLGYIHPEIAGNHSLIVKRDSSCITRIPETPDAKNWISMNATVRLNPDASAVATIEERGFMDFWERYYPLTRMNDTDRANSILSTVSLPRAKVAGVSVDSDNSPEPSCTLHYTVDAASYAGVTGSRLFVPANPFRNIGGRFSSDTRVNDLYFKSGYRTEDSISLIIPEGYIVESIPKDAEYSNDLGSVSLRSTEKSPTVILLEFKFIRNSGTFPSTEYDNYKTLVKKAESIFKTKVILRKTE
jgi:hypothetical protein